MPTLRHTAVLVLVLGLTTAPLLDAAALGDLTVKAGVTERRESVVSFKLPAALAAARSLIDKDGKAIPLQVDANGEATFILPHLAAGDMARFKLSTDAPSAEAVKAQREGSTLKLTVDDKTVFRYQAEPSALPRPDIKPIFQRGGYIHPVFSPSGKLVTDDYPANHIHHHGIWSPWTKTEFAERKPDFWNMGDGKGRVEFVALDGFWSGPVHAGFEARHRFMDLTAPEPVNALNELWQVKLFHIKGNTNAYWVFDFTSSQQCATTNALKLPKYHYGGLGFRGNWAWNGKDNTYFLTSEGETDRVKGNETRGRWCHISGLVDGQRTGVAILGHPKNYRAPQPMRINPTEPFFCFAPQQLGDMEIKPGEVYTMKYRFIVADGAPDAKELNRLWEDYASPVEVVLP